MGFLCSGSYQQSTTPSNPCQSWTSSNAWSVYWNCRWVHFCSCFLNVWLFQKKKYCSFEPDVIQRYFVMLASTSDHTDAINWMAVLNQIWYRDVLSCLLVRLILLMQLIAQVSIDSISVKTLVQPCAVTHECTQSHRWRFFFFFF